MFLKSSPFLLWLFVCFKLSLCQSDLINLCSKDGSTSCICDEFTDVKYQYTLRVMCSFQNIVKIDNKMRIPNNTISLDFSVNNLTELSYVDLFDNINLFSLNFNRNRINKIDAGTFADLPNLMQLDLSENELTNLSPDVLHGVFKLKVLYLFSNKFTTLSNHLFYGVPELESLSLSHNNIGNFLLNSGNIFSPEGIWINPQLTQLDLENVNITNIPDSFFADAFNLRELSLKNNPIDRFPRLPFTIESLDISGTLISYIHEGDTLHNPAMRNFFMNDLKNLTVLEKYTFLPMKGLKKIEMQNCKKLQYVDKNAFYSDDSDTEFTIVDLNFMGSGLRTLDEHLMPFFSKLSSLDLRSNPWVCDCKIKWLLDLRLPDQIKNQIRCDRPPNHRGKLLYSLSPNDLRCDLWSVVMDKLIRILLVILCLCLGGLVVWFIVLRPPRNANRSLVGPDSPYSRITTIQPNRIHDEL